MNRKTRDMTDQGVFSPRAFARMFVWTLANILNFRKTVSQRTRELEDVLEMRSLEEYDYWSAVGRYLTNTEREHGKEIDRECWARN